MLDEQKNKEYIAYLNSRKRISGLTHAFYRYPASFSPQFIRDTILKFSREGDVVLDAFMGGGTTVVEAIANGRNAIGIDINPLAHFITKVKTTPLSLNDREEILRWVEEIDISQMCPSHLYTDNEDLKNIPEKIKAILIQVVDSINKLRFPRQRNFARCALLRFGQWAVDCYGSLPSNQMLKDKIIKQVIEMLDGINEFVYFAKSNGIYKNNVTSVRNLYCGTIDELIKDPSFARLRFKTKLVLTSPPYPGVHVLYHRWQINGRRETPAPFWLAGLRNGHGESFYTLGGRSASGLVNYFLRIGEIFHAIRSFIHPDATIVQLVAFSNPQVQLASFLNVMNSAGFDELTPLRDSNMERPVRKVPNRKWYTYSSENQHASNEVLLFHRPRL